LGINLFFGWKCLQATFGILCFSIRHDEAVAGETFASNADMCTESARLLGVSATAFHWPNEDMALIKIAGLLRLVGNGLECIRDNSRPDPFRETTKALLTAPSSLSAGSRDIPFALDADARAAALERTGAFDAIEFLCNGMGTVAEMAASTYLCPHERAK
jgi:hypothetical protein